RLSYADAGCYSLMVGFGEAFLPAFVLALGMGEIIAGLVSTVPLMLGGLLQLLAPIGIRACRSYQRWVVACASLQALSFVPMIVLAIRGTPSVWIIFGAALVYWASGFSASPAWNNWIEGLIPSQRLRAFLTTRSRMTQISTLVAFIAAGCLLQYG